MLNKVKFLGLIAATTLSAAVSQANPEGATPPSNNSQFYTGALIGYSSMGVKNKESVHVNGISNAVKNHSFNSNGVVGTILLGYRQLFDNNYLMGFEFGVSLDNNSINKTENLDIFQTQTKLKAPYKFTPALVFGNQFSKNWLGFVKLGISISRFELYHSIANLPAAPIPGATSTIHTTKAGFMAALGAEHALTNSISAVGLVSYENFGKIQHTYDKVLGGAGESNTVTMRPEYYTVKVGLINKF